MNVQQADLRGAEVPLETPTPDPGWVAPSVLSADVPTGPDHLGRSALASFLAEVVAHRAAGTPFCIGIFGPAGAGKSRFMASLLAAAEMLARKAGVTDTATPFDSNLIVVRVQAEPGNTPARSLLRQVAAALAATYPRLTAEASHAGLDARKLARDAAEHLNEARQRLDVQRRSLESFTGQHASLADHVLFDTAGAGIDAYARANRGRLERTLRGFGIQGDPVTAYKEAVRDANEANGPASRWTSVLPAFFAYRGQVRLLVLAVALLLAAWGIGALIANEEKLVDAVRGLGDKMGGVADWLQARWGWLHPVRRVFRWGALGAVAINLVRGLRFLLPVRRGVALLREDIAARRRDLDSALAYQTNRVGALTREAEVAGRQAEAAEARLAAAGPVLPTLAQAETASDPADIGTARSFFATIEAAMRAARGPASRSAPARIVVGIDGLGDLSAADAAAFLQTAHALLARPGFVLVLGADRVHLATGIAETDPALAAARLNGWIQIPHLLAEQGEDGGAWAEAGPFARALLDAEPGETDIEVPDHPDATRSGLDRPWADTEIAAIEALAPLAGSTPRAVKRFVNLYRVARADPRLGNATREELAALALGLALQSAGLPFGAVGGPQDDVKRAQDAIEAALGTPLDLSRGARGARTARFYSMGA